MGYDLIIRPEAKSDLLDAFHWYQEKGLGSDTTSNYVLMKSYQKFKEILFSTKKYFKAYGDRLRDAFLSAYFTLSKMKALSF
jgi:hypothetical protein